MLWPCVRYYSRYPASSSRFLTGLIGSWINWPVFFLGIGGVYKRGYGLMKVIRSSTRTVLLAGSWAFKIPSFRSWDGFLRGLLANMQEAEFSLTEWPELCPVSFSIPLGLLVVMPYCRPLSEEEWPDRGEYMVPVEMKPDSFGILEGRIVAVDYGS